MGIDVSVLWDAYRSSGLPDRTMGRSMEEDRDFFLAGLAGGALLAQLIQRKEQS